MIEITVGYVAGAIAAATFVGKSSHSNYLDLEHL